MTVSQLPVFGKAMINDFIDNLLNKGVRVTLIRFKFGGKNKRGGHMTIIEKIKLLFAVKKPVTALVNDVKQIKSGYKTLTFWVTIIGGLISVCSALAGFIPPTIALIISTALGVLYNIVRALQNAGVDGVTPVAQSTRFLVMVAGIVYAGLLSLKAGGVDPKWVETAIAILGAIGAASQSLGAQQPKADEKVEVKS
jgi:hypothetical protein